MNIHYLSFSKVPSRDANSVHVMNMCHALAVNEHKVTLFAKRGDNMALNPFDHYGVSPSFKLVRCLFPKIRIIGDIVYGLDAIRRFISEEKPDLYFGRHPYLLILASLRGIPIIYDSHDVPQAWFRQKIEGLIMRSKQFRRLTVTSEISKKEYLRIYPYLQQSRVIVARNGATIPSNKELEPINNWPGRKNHLQVGYTGHLYPGRGMNIIYSMAKTLTNIDFHIVGGNEADIQKWHDRSMPSNLYFHGYVPHKLIASYLNRFDIVLAPYQKKVTIGGGKGDTSQWMCPLKIFGYMAAEKTIVSSKLPALEEILKDKVNALLVEPEDTKEWINTIKELEENPDLRRSLAKEAYMNLKLNYTWTKRAHLVLHNLKL